MLLCSFSFTSHTQGALFVSVPISISVSVPPRLPIIGPSHNLSAHTGDLVEQIELIDEFTNPKSGKTSKVSVSPQPINF